MQPASFMQETAPGEFEKLLNSSGPAVVHLAVVRNHDLGQIVVNLTITVTQEKPQVWRARYVEKTRRLTCQPADLVQFRYRPRDDPASPTDVDVHSVNLVGTFNDWDRRAMPMTNLGDGTFVKYLKLDEGIHYYKFFVNGDVWMQDPNSDPALREDNGHNSFNSGIFIGEQGKDFGPASPRDINLAAVRHDPQQARYFNVVSSDSAEVKLRTLHDNVQHVVLHWRDRRDRDIPMERDGTEFDFDYWDATVSTESTNKTAYYYFTLSDAVTNRTYAASDGHWFACDLTERFPTPDWARNVVWYQIFMDRFRNGTTDNDPPHTLPWRWDWYKLAAWESLRQDNPQFSNDWYGRRFGGDFQGVLSELPYFRELGVTALYFCPIFEAGSNHGYDTIDYRHVSQYFGFKGDNEAVIGKETLDPKTWQWTASDRLFLLFIKEAHKQGLKVIIDGVFNHMGRNSFALKDVLAKGEKSPYADWFDITSWGPPVKYNSWDRGGGMPNFHKDSEKGYASDSAKQYIFDITRRWMDPNGNGDSSDGVNGWRLDVAQDVPAAFWIDWRKLVKGINSNAYITGEIWGIATKYLQGNEWDAVMNYQFAMRSIHYFMNQKRKTTAASSTTSSGACSRRIRSRSTTSCRTYTIPTTRPVGEHGCQSRPRLQPERPSAGWRTLRRVQPGPAAYQIQKLMATFQMTFLGAPIIWYGDEAGMFGAGDPVTASRCSGRTWSRTTTPRMLLSPDLWEHYRRVIAIRNTYPALRTGRFHTWVTDDPNEFTDLRAREATRSSRWS